MLLCHILRFLYVKDSYRPDSLSVLPSAQANKNGISEKYKFATHTDDIIFLEEPPHVDNLGFRFPSLFTGGQGDGGELESGRMRRADMKVPAALRHISDSADDDVSRFRHVARVQRFEIGKSVDLSEVSSEGCSQLVLGFLSFVHV